MNNGIFREKLRLAENYQFRKFYRSAIREYQQAINEFPEHTMVLSYNLGALFQTELGYGDKAKDYYKNVVTWYENNYNTLPEALGDVSSLKTILANAYENLSLLADSFEEFYSCCSKVFYLNPSDKNLREAEIKTKNAQDSGMAWPKVYYEMAQMFWNVVPTKNRGLYGFGASIYRRLLINRGIFRLDRQLFEFCANGYGGLMMMIIAEIASSMKNQNSNVNEGEIDFIVKDTIELLDIYLEINTHDHRVTECVKQLKQTLGTTRKTYIINARGIQNEDQLKQNGYFSEIENNYYSEQTFKKLIASDETAYELVLELAALDAEIIKLHKMHAHPVIELEHRVTRAENLAYRLGEMASVLDGRDFSMHANWISYHIQDLVEKVNQQTTKHATNESQNSISTNTTRIDGNWVSKIKCKLGFHVWAGCFCKYCGNMASSSSRVHVWDGCYCRNCGCRAPLSSSVHRWDRCICISCGIVLSPGSSGHSYPTVWNFERCTICLGAGHVYGIECGVCYGQGGRRYRTYTGEACIVCGTKGIYRGQQVL